MIFIEKYSVMKKTLNEEKERIINIMSKISKPINEWYDDEYYEKPKMPQGIGDFKNIDWKELFEILVDNRRVMSGESKNIGANTHDLTDYDGMLSREELRHLEEFGLLEIINSFPVISTDYDSFDKFYERAKEIWSKESPGKYGGDDSETPFLRGRETES